jgi:hypothetical protein
MSLPPNALSLKGIWHSKKGKLLFKFWVLDYCVMEFEHIEYYKHINDVLGAIATNKIWRENEPAKP